MKALFRPLQLRTCALPGCDRQAHYVLEVSQRPLCTRHAELLTRGTEKVEAALEDLQAYDPISIIEGEDGESR